MILIALVLIITSLPKNLAIPNMIKQTIKWFVLFSIDSVISLKSIVKWKWATVKVLDIYIEKYFIFITGFNIIYLF